MNGVNKAIIIGTLGDEPTIRYTASGDCCATLSVATNENWKDKDGNKKESTEWHRVVLWRKTAEIADRYLTKGSQVYIEGKIQTRKWQDKEGNDRYTTEINGFNLQMLGGTRKEGDNQKPSAPEQPEDDFNDDIPFSRVGA